MNEIGSHTGGVDIAELPGLHLADWRATKDTLHLYCQIIGKVRLATTPPRNHWWNAPLYVDVRGLTTRRLHHSHTTFEITLDFVDHALVVRTADGRTRPFELGRGLPVANFDAAVHEILRELGIDVMIKEEPFGVPMKTPFKQDTEHAAWDRDAVERFGSVLDWSDSVFEEFSGWFNGKTSPVHLFWHSLDLAVTRFSGRPAPPVDADQVTKEAYTHEVISFGFWAGDDTIGDASYYSYTAPEPPGLRDQSLAVGEWTAYGQGSMAILPYETVRTAPSPRNTLLAFCQSAYEAGARLANWDMASFTSTWCPTPEQLKQLRASAAADFGRTSLLAISSALVHLRHDRTRAQVRALSGGVGGGTTVVVRTVTSGHSGSITWSSGATPGGPVRSQGAIALNSSVIQLDDVPPTTAPISIR